eukprot:TRINITY_DN16283_c0_g1_i1.p1 TRINITY_DN16283_c0_g1~~TRINITY_DN16283_c0_g1_i1.p1  ORF type:complete len:496 (+),score=132.66 TRINITY_DN16283_c0_g1_i1:79-1566(+)
MTLSAASDFASARLSVDYRSVTALRSGLALLILHDLWQRVFDDGLAFVTSDGVVSPGDTPHRAIPHLVWFYRGPWWWQALQAAAAGALSVSALVGDGCWRWVGLYVLMAGFQGRSQHCHDGSDKLLRHLTAWAAVLPHRPPPSGVVTGPAAAGVVLQVLLLYLLTEGMRSSQQWWPPALSAVYYVMNQTFGVGVVGAWLGGFPDVCRLLTLGTHVAEIGGPVMALLLPVTSTWRVVPAAALVLLQAGIFVAMTLVNFQLVAALANVVLLPTAFWDGVQQRCSALPSLRRGIFRYRRGSSKSDPILPTVLGGDTPGRLPSSRSVAAAMLGYMLYKLAGDAGLVPLVDGGNVGELSRMNQGWNMFSPGPPTHGDWWVMTGTTEDGVAVDMLRWIRDGSAPLPVSGAVNESLYVRPECASHLYRNFRWERFLSVTSTRVGEEKFFQGRVSGIGGWICRSSPVRLRDVNLVLMRDRVLPPGGPKRHTPPERAASHRVQC